MKKRQVSDIIRNPWRSGFLGNGHQARAVLDGVPFEARDPFILFMDDSLDFPGGEPVGGAHPHAGFETLTLVLEGNEKDWKTGSFEVMTAGKGIVHTEEITSRTKLRILQVWLALSPEKRNAQPFLQRILLDDVPKKKTAGHEIRVYSGSSNGLTSPLINQTPFTLVDFRLEKNATVNQELPPHYNGLVYVLNGAVRVGHSLVSAGETAILEKSSATGEEELHFEATQSDTRFVVYAGWPHRAPLVHHGPFVADSMQDIHRMYREYRERKFPHLDELPAEQRITYSSAQAG